MMPKKITTEDPTVVEQVQTAGELPVEVNGVQMVLMTVDARRGLHKVVGDQFDIAETYPASEKALAVVWDDPQLDEYTVRDGSPIE